MKFRQPNKNRFFQFDSELHHCLQFLVRDSSGNIIDRVVPLIVETLESLNKLGIRLYREFRRLDRFDVMTGQCDRAMTRRPQLSCCNRESCIEGSDEPEIG